MHVPFQYPHGYAQFTVQIFTHKTMLAMRGMVKPDELLPPDFPVFEYVKTYGAETVRGWIATYCELGTRHQDQVTYAMVMADIARAEGRLRAAGIKAP